MSKTALSIPIGILLARTLGAEGKGAVAVTQTTAAVAVVLLNLGMPSAVMWLAAQGRASARSALRLGAMFGLGIAALGAVFAFAFTPERLAAALGLPSSELLILALVATVPSMLAYFEDAYLVGRGVIRNNQAIDVLSLASQLVAMIVLALVGKLSVTSAVIAWLAVSIVATALKAVLAVRTTGSSDEGVIALWKEGRAYGLKAWLGSTVNLLSLRQDVLLLGAFAGASQVGIYTISVAAAELSWYIPNALQGVATAKFAAEEDSAELARRLNRSVWPFTVVFSAVVFVVAAPLLPLVYGQDFRASVLPLALLIPGIIATSMSSSLSAWLTGRGHPEDAALANGVNMVVNLGANIVLAPRLGAPGAAIASSISYSAAAILIVWRFRHRAGGPLRDALLPRITDIKAMASIISSELRRRAHRREVD